jgi:hypothetical protein
MSPGNVDLVRSIFAEWERGDFSSSEWAHPHLELVIADGPTPGHWKGLSVCAEAWRYLHRRRPEEAHPSPPDRCRLLRAIRGAQRPAGR